ncbi:MAG TPA: M20 family metallo-hydrolase [Methanomassiliicoccales archaeon]|nr:M20 family metallo-hydrolase [Methanomassiliicoccales archaeon]
MPSLEEIVSTVETYRNDMVDALTEMLRIPAIGPENGGEGEFERARFVRELAERCGFEDVEMYDALDERVRLRLRPNVVAKKKGQAEQMVWIVSHMDTVTPGNLDAWTYPPFSPKVMDGKLYGLGAEDNGQALVGSLFASKALNELGLVPERGIGLAIVSDEETGNTKGIKFLIDNNVFHKNDFIYVPDFGVADGSVIEVAEKHILWLKVKVMGRQTHASTPGRGINAMKVGSQMIDFLVDQLNGKFGALETSFLPPTSTFEPTKRLQNVGNVNTVPGEDTFWVDSRILPQYNPEDVLETARGVARVFEERSGARISVEIEQINRSGPPSSTESIALMSLASAVKKIRGVDAIPRGIGGGTCANLFRLAGYDAYVWQTVDEMAHSVNEYCRVDNLVDDAKVYATVLGSLCYSLG